MSTKVFLSLHFSDLDFAKSVRARLPGGLAYFYEESFENGELLLQAMERAVKDSSIFVLFASKVGQASPWVNFEINQARMQKILNPNHRILIFPTDSQVRHTDLPAWLHSYWVPRAGYSAADVARYITGILLEPNVGMSAGAVRVVGRGKTLDRLEQIVADSIARTRLAPTVYFLSGFRGVGRRTFAAYYMRNALSSDVNLPFGPTLTIPSSADLADLHQALRTEISPTVEEHAAIQERSAYEALPLAEQVRETVRLIGHFSELGQAVTIASSGGFFEDRGDPKDWVFPLFNAIKSPALLFVISNRQLPQEQVEASPNVVQMRVDELHEKDVRTLMIFTAERLRINDFAISDDLVLAIGGHADVANAAVRLAAVKGCHILERDPRQLYNIQNTILGESIEADALTDTQKKVLCLLSWVPSLHGNVIEAVLLADGVPVDDVLKAIENLHLGCLITSAGSNHSISPAIRLLFRRFNVTPPGLLKRFSRRLGQEWQAARDRGHFRADLFEAFVFMHSLEGKALPQELLPLLTPGMLADVIRDTYARGKDETDTDILERVVSWGRIAEKMRMSEATREEILSTVARAKIRLGRFADAEITIKSMASRRYRSVPFLLGHMYRRKEDYSKAIEMLVEAVRSSKFNRSAVHELALAYKKSGRAAELRKLLSEHGSLIKDSAMFADFQIGIDLARGDLTAAEQNIEHLRRMPDDEGRSDIRRAQLLMRRQLYQVATAALTNLITYEQRNLLRIRSIRAIAAARAGNFDLARKDIEFVKKFPSWEAAGLRLEAGLLVEQRRTVEARAILDRLTIKGAEDWLLYARALDAEADLPSTATHERQEAKRQAAEIRQTYNFALEYDFGE